MQSEDELKSENMLLKLKLEMEHGMQMMDTSALDPEIENRWLSDIYKFEQQYKKAGKIKLYDMIGRPDFKPHPELSPAEIKEHLKRLQNLMAENQISFNCLCDYEDAIIYRFITEELFEYEMDDIRVDGMVQHFMYEDFYPNHIYDLKRYATEFIEKVLLGNWVPEFDESDLASSVTLGGKKYDQHAISTIILTFQEVHRSIKINDLTIGHVEFDLEKEIASVRLHLSYSAQPGNGIVLIETGKSHIQFQMLWDYWRISSFQLPGFGG